MPPLKPPSQSNLYDPSGQRFNQKIAEELSKEEELVFLCGHYEALMSGLWRPSVQSTFLLGILPYRRGASCNGDDRLHFPTGARVLGNGDSAEIESFYDNLLEYPQYTRPEVFEGRPVPEVLLTGHHKNIEAWRREQSIRRTLERRPDLLAEASLTLKEQKFLDSLKSELGQESILKELETYIESLWIRNAERAPENRCAARWLW